MDTTDATNHSPFGYQFHPVEQPDEQDLFALHFPPSPKQNGLLDENEKLSLQQFFNLNNPGPALEDSGNGTLDMMPGGSGSGTGFADSLWLEYCPPASVHHVSTTIADQSHLTHGFHTEHALPFDHQILSADPFTTGPDEFQAASTLYHNAQNTHANANANANAHGHTHPSHANTNARAYSMPDLQRGLALSNLGVSPTVNGNSHAYNNAPAYGNIPLVNTHHGPIDEQLAALLPNHSEQGTVDAIVASQFSQARRRQGSHFGEPLPAVRRESLKRTYTYGTDSAFNETGYIAPEAGLEEAVHERLENDLRMARPLIDEIAGKSNGSDIKSGSGEDGSENGDGSNGHKRRRIAQDGEEDSKPATGRNGSTGGRATKATKGDGGRKKKRVKGQRENLSEEQKRNNHILSEQKRRDIIKRGFKDLEFMVPECRRNKGAMSKSTVLMASAEWLKNLIDGNREIELRIKAMAGDPLPT
ncbi:hypothetical protein BU24DRAFT_142055 [Aaosphaeria arxii CBS 175.79]|uniref:BHLH domain-containing protein n=1 Tax=Aaosphaeria arxii CBS 175.79 TaxID=1450172 RepID=A0A6A5XVP3_9PLEO|nr:uncharacterized protein BU24DRAFT_142055 [Aaosphaeria arxii CBS 175.79]KAF2017016.1 hypothetical protein BU24DRAFT_142055 [Aaosphaeria arxii CBS 175.79]